jgi:pilus assembly protein CpaE
MNASFRLFQRNVFNSGQASSIALVSPRRPLQERLRSALKEDKRFHFVAVQGDLAQARSNFRAGSQPSILIADLQGDPEASIAAIEHLRSDGFTGALITLSEGLDETTVRALLRLHVTDWLPADVENEEIIQACERALSSRRLGDGKTRAKCYAFVPAAGGVGNTTLAIQTAFLLGKKTRNLGGTCLVDLNFGSGALADYLDLQPLFDADAIANDPSRLDNRLLEVMLARHATGLAVLAGPRAPAKAPHVDGKLVTNALGVVSDSFEHMVLDLPTTWQKWTFDVLAGSDQIFVVTEFTVPAMRKAHELAEAIAERFDDERSIRVIVNKFRQQLFGGGLRKVDATGLFRDSLAGFVAEDHELINEAINRGEILSTISHSNRVSRDLSRIVLGD